MRLYVSHGGSSGFAFYDSNYNYSNANAGNASHLCTKLRCRPCRLAKNNNKLKVLVAVAKTPIRLQRMKRITNLFDTITSLDNLSLAHQKAKRGKSKSYGVSHFERNVMANLQQLHMELTTETYRTSGYTIFKIYEPKEREIYRLPYRDRVVHHAIMNVLEPIWTPIFVKDTYSAVKGRGIHGAARRLRRDLHDETNTVYCLKMDIRKFYPSIDHQTLKVIVRRKIKDSRVLALLDEIIDSAPGVPIGNYLSQFFANLYLSYFDHWLKEQKRIKYYYRYADDMVILAPNKASLHELLAEIRRYLYDRLKLEIKGNYQIFPVADRGIDFVGYVFYHTHTLMRKGIKQRMCRKAARLRKQNLIHAQFMHKMSPHLGWAKHCDSKRLLKKVIYNEQIL